MGRECELIDEELNDHEEGGNIDEDIMRKHSGEIPNDLKKTYEELEQDAEKLFKNKNDLKKRRYRLFAYVTSKKNRKSPIQNPEQKLFPSMNPNLSGNIPTIFSCKPRFRVTLEPGDVIFCYPKSKGLGFKIQRITLVLIVIKKVEIQVALQIFPFKSVQYTQSFSFNQHNLCQFGDITASFSNNMWNYAGNPSGSTPHGDDPIRPIKLLNELSCFHRGINNPKTFQPNKTLTCKGCPFYETKQQTQGAVNPCFMRSGTWQYDILFKWGLVGCCESSFPLEFRSFYLGSKGMPLQDFKNILGNPKNKNGFNERDYSEAYMDANGKRVLDKLRESAIFNGLLKRN